jgi:GT2 family glycosyltransferase
VLSATIVVPTFERPVALARTLDALLRMDVPGGRFEIIVVDTGSPDADAHAVAMSRRAHYIRCPNEGVAAARNCGAREGSGELLLFVDDDIVVDETNLRKHENRHAADPRCLVSGHWEFDPTLRARLQQTPLGRHRLAYEDRYNRPDGVASTRQGQVHPVSLAASNLSVRRDVFWSLGGFDERFPVGAEDQDLTWRARRDGCTLIYDYDILVIHNDQHRDFRSLCLRQERAAVGSVYWALKNPEVPAPEMVRLNGPLQVRDPPRLVVRKLSRGLLSNRFALSLLLRLVRAAEAVRPDGGWPLDFLYTAVGGLYVFRGVRLALRLTSRSSWPMAHTAMRGSYGA